MTNTPIIRLERVSKQYDATTVVDTVTLNVHQGDLLVLLGSSGCGKTTTLRLVAGLERPNQGLIWLDGRAVAGAGQWVPPEERRIGMVFQDFALFPHLSVQENIAFALQDTRGQDRQRRVNMLLDLVGLSGLGKRYPHQLSGGQQQRIALARALAPQPSVVLLDEPFSNLDAALRKTMREEVRRILQATETTAIFVTHDQEEALSLADTVAVMQAGEILQVGQPDELYRFPASLDVATFLGETNLIPGQAKGDSAHTFLGALPLARPAIGEVTVMIRPESLILSPASTGATVSQVRFYGYYQTLLLDVPDQPTPLLVRVWADETYHPGDVVAVDVRGPVVGFVSGS